MSYWNRITDDPPRAADGYAQGSAWCVVLGVAILVAVAIGIVAGVG